MGGNGIGSSVLFLGLIFSFLLSLSDSSLAIEGKKEEELSFYKLALSELQYVKGPSLIWEEIESSPNPINIITAEEIKRYGWHNLRDLLEFQPSFYLLQDVNERVIAHRGIYRTITSHLAFLERGRWLNTPGYRNFILDNSFPMLGVSRVEITRGGGASLYGEAGFSGVINIERDFPKKGAKWTLSYGEPEAKKSTLLFSQKISEGLFFQGLWHYQDERGEKLKEEGYTLRVHPRPKNYSYQLELAKDDLSFYWHHFYNRYDTPRSQRGRPLSSEDLEPFGSFEKAKLDLIGLSWEESLKGWKIKLNPYLLVFSIDTPQIATTHREGSFLAQDISLLSRGTYLEGLAIKDFGRGIFLMGFKLGKDDYERTRIMTYNGTFRETSYPSQEEPLRALFAQLKYEIKENLILNLGLRYDYYEAFGDEWSPRLALIWKLKPNLSLLLSYTHGFQAPPFLYRQSNVAFYGSEGGLKPETLDVYTLSTFYQISLKQFLQLSFFQQKGKDFFSFNPDKKIYQNVGRVSSRGFEGEWKYLGESCSSFLNFSYLSVKEAKDWSLVQGKDVLYFPRTMLKGGLSYRVLAWPEFFVSPQFRWYDKVRKKEGGYLPSYVVGDVNLFWRKGPWEASFKVENIFDKHYHRGGTINRDVPFQGRTFLFQLEGQF